MTAKELVAEARRNRVAGATGVVNVHKALTMIIDDIVLKSCDYEREPTSTPAIVARALAALIASIEDSRAAYVHLV